MSRTSPSARARRLWISSLSLDRLQDQPRRGYVRLHLESLESILAPNLFSLVGSLLPGLTALGAAGLTAAEDYAANVVSYDPVADDIPAVIEANTSDAIDLAVFDATAPPTQETSTDGDRVFGDPANLADLTAPLPNPFAAESAAALSGWVSGAGRSEPLSAPLPSAVESAVSAPLGSALAPAVPRAALDALVPLPTNAPTPTPQPPTAPTNSNTALQALAQQGLRFETNAGQIDAHYNFVAHASTFDVALSATDATLALKSAPDTAPAMLNMQLVGANPNAAAQGGQVLPGITNYLGGPGATFTGITSYAGATFQNVYNGVDVTYHSTPGASQLEYNFVVAPHADAGQVALAFQGTNGGALNAQGGLVLHTAAGDVTQQAPVAYQILDGARHDVASSFTLDAAGHAGFTLGAYDHAAPLTIDPTYTYSSYLGGANADTANAVAVNPTGAPGSEQVFVVGATSSATFRPNDGNRGAAIQPTLLGAGPFTNAAYAIDIDPTNNNAPIYLDYIGGNNAQVATAIAVDASNNAYITGWTSSFQGFPVTAAGQKTLAAQQAAHGGNPQNPNLDAFAVFLDGRGNQTYGTYLGGGADDAGYGIALDNNGNVYVAGMTYSLAFGNKALDAILGGTVPGQSQDGFVGQINPQGVLASLVYVGGTASDQINAIATGPGGHVYLAGTTTSTDLLLNLRPTNAAFQTVLAPAAGGGTAADAFVADLVYKANQPAGPTVNYETYFGGDGTDKGLGLTLDPVAGDAYLVGSTSSSVGAQGAGWGGGGANPVILQPTVLGTTGGIDAYVAKFDANGAPNGAKPYFVYIAGTATDTATAVALVPRMNATPLLYVAGTTTSADNLAGAFPATQGLAKLQNFNQGVNATSSDTWLAQLNPFVMANGVLNPAASIVALSYIGGSDNDSGTGVAFDSWAGNLGNAWVSGTTSSNDFRVGNVGGLQTSTGGGTDGFVVSVKP